MNITVSTRNPIFAMLMNTVCCVLTVFVLNLLFQGMRFTSWRSGLLCAVLISLPVSLYFAISSKATFYLPLLAVSFAVITWVMPVTFSSTFLWLLLTLLFPVSYILLSLGIILVSAWLLFRFHVKL